MKLNEYNKRLFNELKTLNLPVDQYVVFGSGPMGIRNLRKMKDLDVFITPKLWDNLIKTHKSEDGEHIKLSEHVDAWRVWYYGKWESKELISKSEIIDGIKFVPLKIVLEWKKNRNSPKDKKDVILIENYLASDKNLRQNNL